MKSLIGSARGQTWMLKKKSLEVALNRVDTSIVAREAKLLELDGRIKRATHKIVLEGASYRQDVIDQESSRLALQRTQLEAYKTERASIVAAIQALEPAQAEIQARREHQREFARLASKRRACDVEADRLIDDLRRVLEKRSGLSAEMSRSAASFELKLAGRLDESRLEGLLNVLPQNVLSQTDRWLGDLFGNAKDAKSYVVCIDSLTLPETFPHSGVYHFAEEIRLREEDARELLRTDRCDLEGSFASDLLPASIMPAEEWAALQGAAKEKGTTIHWELTVAHREHCERVRVQAEEERRNLLFPAASREPVILRIPS